MVGSSGVSDPVAEAASPAASRPTRHGRRRDGRRRRLVAGVVLVLAVLYPAATFLQVWHAAGVDERRPSDAIVVLGAAQYDGRPSPVFQGRLDTAAELWRAGVAPRIVTTGANQEGDRFTEAESGRRYLAEQGVPEEAIVAVPVGRNTWQELEATAAVLRAAGHERVTLVSDPYHAYRIGQIADDVGLDGAVVSTPGSASLDRLLRETAGASLGRLVGYERLSRLG
jgi:uncharacterized SAM-binding protein YcdF (DUF218 family)